jgi:acetyltransferase-like isoleucine patch superfamily enzyme
VRDLLRQINKHVFMETANKLFQFCIYPMFSVYLLRLFGATIGKGSRVYTPLILNNTKYRNLRMGKNCYVSRDVFFDLIDEIILGDKVTISMRCTFVTHIDVGESPLNTNRYNIKTGKIIIGDGVYIGASSTILCGIKIGENAVVGAGSLVNKDVPAGFLVAGVPARVIKAIQ